MQKNKHNQKHTDKTKLQKNNENGVPLEKHFENKPKTAKYE